MQVAPKWVTYTKIFLKVFLQLLVSFDKTMSDRARHVCFHKAHQFLMETLVDSVYHKFNKNLRYREKYSE